MEDALAMILVLTLVNTVMHLAILVDGFNGEKHEEKDR